MKNFKAFTKKNIFMCLLLLVFSTGCHQNDELKNEISIIKKENKELKEKIYSMEINLNETNKAVLSHKNLILILQNQDKLTLNLIGDHLKYQHGF